MSAHERRMAIRAQVITVADTPPQPWRNGGGSTRELLAWPSATDWQLRLSVADIAADGPFSVFDGVQRWFVVLHGAGVALTINGQAQQQRRADAPLQFDGAATTDCRLLDGPTRDLNLMLRQRPGGLMQAVPGQAWHSPGAVCGLFSRLAGQCQFTASHGAPPTSQALPAMALLWFDAAPVSLCWQPLTSADSDLDNPTDAPPHAWWLWACGEASQP